VEFTQGTFRARGDTVEIFPAQDNVAVRVEMFGDEIDRISYFEPLTGKVVREVEDYMQVVIYPAKHFVMPQSQIDRALVSIEEELKDTVAEFEKQGQLLEAQRIMQRTRFDIEMIEELGYCSGIENYSRHFDGRKPGEAPSSLLDFFPDDYLLIIDESHVTIPQIGGMHNGDRARKKSLIEYGFRLPSAYDNRPLNYREFEERINQAVYVSATPADYELGLSDQVVEQIIRPTGLVDPPVQVRPVANQIDDLMEEVRKVSESGYRTLVTTLTKKMAEDLTDYLLEMGIRVRYMHSDIDTLERAEIVRELRKGTFDVLVGINLLREGLDIPEVALVAILDADKEGFLRSERSLIQTIGRASRNVDAYAIMYADRITGSMSRAMSEMERRRNLQLEFNRKHNITPTSIMKEIQREIVEAEEVSTPATGVDMGLSKMEATSMLIDMEAEMHEAARNLEFEEAARLRDAIREMRETYSL
jgi:excinuclease ABC subunit B